MAVLTPLKVNYRADGSASYTTVDGDIVGLLCCRHYGHEWGTTETVLASNQGLSSYGPVLPAGVVVVFPKITEAQETDSRRDTVNLYDD